MPDSPDELKAVYRAIIAAVESPGIETEIRSSRSLRLVSGPFKNPNDLEQELNRIRFGLSSRELASTDVVVRAKDGSAQSFSAEKVANAFAILAMNGRPFLNLPAKRTGVTL